MKGKSLAVRSPRCGRGSRGAKGLTAGRYVFIINPQAGRRNGGIKLAEEIEARMGSRGAAFSVRFTEREGHAREMAREEAETGDGVVVVSCSGDGTVNECADGLVGHDNAALAVIPRGRGNDFVKSLGRIEDFDIDAAVDGEIVRIDTLDVNGRCCLNLASVGIDADVNSYIGRYSRIPLLRGPMAYNLALVERLFKPLSRELTVSIDGEVSQGRFLLAAAGNGRVYGGGYKATPEALLDDGLIDVVTVSEISLLKVSGVLADYKNGRHVKDGVVADKLRGCLKYVRAKSLRVTSEKQEFAINNDGTLSFGRVMDVHIVPRSINVVAPPRCDRRGLSAAERG